MADVVLEDINKEYSNGFKAVTDLNLEINEGEFLVMVGPSGCGKSTTLRMIAGLEDITSGTLKIGSRVVNTLAPKDRDIAMVFQNYALYPHMNVFDNIAFSLKLAQRPKAEIRERVHEAARILEMESQLDKRPAQLSGGQRQAGWQWAGPSFAALGFFCSTSPCRISTPSSGCRCGPRSPSCNAK